jgi:hypothetical protein
MERDIHTYIQSDMDFIFLRMRLLASPFGLAIKFFIKNISFSLKNAFEYDLAKLEVPHR